MVHTYCRIALNRCIQLMRSRIKEARSRHVGHRKQNQNSAVTSSISVKQKKQEQEKMSSFQRKKSRSLWDQDESKKRCVENCRLDQKYYQHNANADGSWINLAKGRRSTNNRPNVAKPCSDEAKAFLRQLAKQK